MKNYIKILSVFLITFLCIIGFIIYRRKEEKTIKIGIIQIVEYDALDKARQGFIDELKSQGYEDGKNIKFDFKNAEGDFSNAQTIANNFSNSSYDMIFAISTPCSLAAKNATSTIPIVGCAITNPEMSGLVSSNQKSGTNFVGVSDLPPIREQILLMKELNPNAKKIGIFYSSNDATSQYGVDIAKEEVKKQGLIPVTFNVSNPEEIKQVPEHMVDQADEFFIFIDKTTYSAMPQISEILLKSGKFAVPSDEGAISSGGIATYGMDYYQLGRISGQQAVKILKGELNPQDVQTQYLENTKLISNKEILDKLNIKIPSNLE